MIILHHSASSKYKTKVADINEWHKKWDFKSSLGYYVGYHFVIEIDGKTTQTRKISEAGAHTRGYNNHIGICLTGNFEKEEPTRQQIDSLIDLLTKLEGKVVGHKDLAATLCPGKNFYKSIKKISILVKIKRLINKVLNNLYGKQNTSQKI